MADIICNSCFEPASESGICPACGCSASGPAPRQPRKHKARRMARPAPRPATQPQPEKVEVAVATEEEPEPAPRKADSPWSLYQVLVASAVAIRLSGRYRRTCEPASTRDSVVAMIEDREVDEVATEEDRKVAIAAGAWINQLSGETDYESSLIAAARDAQRKGCVVDADVGRIASAVAAARREKQRARVGPVIFAGIAGQKGRQDLGQVEVREARHMPRYGTWLIKGELVSGPWQGARVSWFGRSLVREGTRHRLRARVKQHSKQYGETQVSYVQLD